jgi:hypothetical protein
MQKGSKFKVPSSNNSSMIYAATNTVKGFHDNPRFSL